MAGVNRTVVFDVSADELWDVISDYEAYPDFVENLESLEITERKGNIVHAEYVLKMAGKKVTYTLKHTESENKKSLKWEMVEGEFFKFNNGGWELKAIGKDKVEATYIVDVGMPFFVPKSFVDTLTGTQLPSMMKAFEDRAKEKRSEIKKPAQSKVKAATAKAVKGKKK